MALEHSEIVKNQYNSAKTAGTASAISLADVKTNDVLRKLDSCQRHHKYALCELCGHGNPWVD
ncbi:hypothetical protein DFH08DRAFT_834946 [Mycena albidolilacea]|uniref:Uncharacterized protein n=1 Tax=Mycena albidolilacea TaxID=1033008 RepID=A0AAD7ARI0_9AGAR|nr:hypothetical protein DFH08DRAFT_834946 [Mycena albidolilacea]